MNKTKVTISRYWDNPTITTVVTNESISLSIDINDFISFLKKEIGSIALTFSNKSFEEKIDNAVATVLEKIKEESAKALD